jgi:hypothetical protein
LPYPYPTPELPEAEPYEVLGMILLRGKPIAGVRVSIVNDRTFRNVLATTDAQGIYRATGLAPGAYFVHYYNDRDNFKIGYWKTRSRPVTSAYGARHPAFDLYLVGMQNRPGMGESLKLPARFTWEAYSLALRYRFRVHDRGGPQGRPYYVSAWLPPEANTFTYDGSINQKGMGAGKLPPGRYLWGVYWDAGQGGEGGNLYQDVVIQRDAVPRADPPGEVEAPPQRGGGASQGS